MPTCISSAVEGLAIFSAKKPSKKASGNVNTNNIDKPLPPTLTKRFNQFSHTYIHCMQENIAFLLHFIHNTRWIYVLTLFSVY